MKTEARASKTRRAIQIATLLVAVATAAPVLADASKTVAIDDLDFAVGSAIESTIKNKMNDLAQGDAKRGVYAKYLTPDGEGYIASVTVREADGERYVVRRYQVPITGSGESWSAGEAAEVDSWDGMSRSNGTKCYPFDKFAFEEHGMTISATRGQVCETFKQGGLSYVAFGSDDLKYDYVAPSYQDYYTLQQFLKKDRRRELEFDPSYITARCSDGECERLMQMFEGVQRIPVDQRDQADWNPDTSMLTGELKKYMDDALKETRESREDNPFSAFTVSDYPGHEYYNLQIHKDDDHRINFGYNNWGGFDVYFGVRQVTTDPEALNGTLFAYYTEETLANNTPYELDSREEYEQRFMEVKTLKGTVRAGLIDPETLEGDIKYQLRIKKPTNLLPFQIVINDFNLDDESKKFKAQLTVNSIRLAGDELTWAPTGPRGGIIIFPDVIPADTIIDLDMNFQSKAIRKVNHAYSTMFRGGWLPFVSFGDFIDECEMTIHTPAQYKTLGIGRRVWDKQEGDVRISHWIADSPVSFASIIFGKYKEDVSGFDALKPDGTKIPVTVHVDEVSMMQLTESVTNITDLRNVQEEMRTGARGIRANQLRSIADQAANSINLFQKISGVEYPYGELNLVNDPAPALYGQAPSSLIYLGSLVFRGEAALAADDGMFGGGGTSTAKFLKSVTAHEVGHQWWGSAIAMKNFRNYWFVESLAEYFSGLYLEVVFGPKEYEEQVTEWRRRVQQVEQWASVQYSDSTWTGPFQGAARQAAIYNKGPYAFHILRKTFGDEKFFPALKEFTQVLAAKREIVTRDIQQALEAAFGYVDADGNTVPVDLEWFFDQWIRSPFLPEYKFDYDVRKNEEGQWLLEGTIAQRAVLGNKDTNHVADGKNFRGRAFVWVTLKDGKELRYPIVVEGAETPFRLPPLPSKPMAVVLNKEGEMLDMNTYTNERW